MRRRAVLLGLALAALPVVGLSELMAQSVAEPAADPAGAGVYERDVVEIEPTRSISLVNIDNRLGDVRIEGHDSKNVIISAFKRAGDEDTLDRLKVTLIPDTSGPVRISTSISQGTEARPIPGGSVKIDLVIRAPRTARVEARVWNGRLTVIGMENGAELSANKGDIDVANASGTIVTHSAAGKQKFVEIFGAVDAQVIAGDVDLSVVRGQRLDASVHQGRIEGRKVRVREVTILATRGDVRFQGQALAGGHYRIATHRGNIAVTFTHGVPVSVWAWSRQGRVELPGGVRTSADARGGLSASMPGDSAPTAVIELRSSVGNIEFAVVQ
jgi:DUF4097 and DUF4098 domain-containing protein YvlB